MHGNCDNCDPIDVYLNSYRTAENDLFIVETILDSMEVDSKYEPFVKQVLTTIRFIEKIVRGDM